MLNDIQLSDTQPGDWVLVGQGRANAVFAYRGSRADLANKVLRLSKPRTAPRPEHAVTLEQKVWKGHLDVSEPDPVLRAFSYVHEVILPQIGRKYIPQQALTEVPAKLAQALLLQISSQTEKARSCPATVLPNNTLFSQQQQGAATVCVELKPKWGLLPKSVAIHPDNGIKRSTSRFQMQQLLKRAQGKTEVVSKYDPLELFSGEDRRVRHAIAALADNPQNNLRIFRDSQPRPFSGLWTSEGRKQLAAALEGWEQPPAKLHDVLIAALQLILMREGDTAHCELHP